MKQFLAKKRETGTAIHQPFVRFDLVDGPFHWSLTPMVGKSRSNSIVIPLNASDKTTKFFNPTGASFVHPFVESFWLLLAEQEKKRLKQLIYLLHFLRALHKPHEVNFLF
ncbi:MAG: hypothetical protein NVS4B9_42320 [Ktedonobacteraceae bacterium]